MASLRVEAGKNKSVLLKARSLVMHDAQNAVRQFAVHLIDMFSQKTGTLFHSATGFSTSIAYASQAMNNSHIVACLF